MYDKNLTSVCPIPKLSRTWYSYINGDPGITEESIQTLKSRIELKKAKGEELVTVLMSDEMTLMKRIDYNGKICYGKVDLGGIQCKKSGTMASHALVYMIVALNEGWKIPIGHFHVNGLDGSERANLTRLILTRCSDIGLNVVAKVCDGPSTNISMLNHLGAIIDPANMKTYFPHPSDPSKRVYVLLDVAHMIKLVRNSFAKLGGFYNYNGEKN